MAPYLLIISLAISVADAATTCQLNQQLGCCQDCEARNKLCQSQSDSLVEATECIRYLQQCQKKCDKPFVQQSSKKKD